MWEEQGIVNKRAVLGEMEVSDKEEAIRSLAKCLYEDGAISDVDDFVKDVLLRESEGQTGIGEGIAIPHGKSVCVKKNCVAVGKTKRPLEWETIDGKPVSVIFLFAVQKEAPAQEHLRMMASVARALAYEQLCAKFKRAENRQELMEAVEEMEKFSRSMI